MIKTSGFHSMPVVSGMATNRKRCPWLVCGLWAAFTVCGRDNTDPNNIIRAESMADSPELEKAYRRAFRKNQLAGSKSVLKRYAEWKTTGR